MKTKQIKDRIFDECKRSIKEILKVETEGELSDAVKRFTNQYTLIREERKKVLLNYYEIEKLYGRLQSDLTTTDAASLQDGIKSYYESLDLFEVPLLEKAKELIISDTTKETTQGSRLFAMLSFKYTAKEEIKSIKSFFEYLHIKDEELVLALIDDAEKEYHILAEFRERIESRKQDTTGGIRDFKHLCDQIRDGTKVIDISKRIERIKRFKDYRNFEEFMRYYFDGIQEDTYMASLAAFHKDAIEKLLSGEKTYQIWEWFRGCGKSMIGTLYIPMWLAVNKKLKGMIIMSHAGHRAQILMAEFYSHISSNARLHADYGKPTISGTPGTATLSVSFNDGFAFNVWALGIEQNPAGLRTGSNRPNYIVVDDADNKVSAGNPRIVAQRMKHIKGALAGCFGVPTRIPNMFIYSNNRVHPDGLTSRMVKELVDKRMGDDEAQSFYYHSKVAITIDPITKEGKTLKEGGVPAWPEYMSVEYIKRQIATMTPAEASMELYHKYIPEDDQFNSEWIILSDPPPTKDIQQLLVYCDPAYSSSQHAAHSAIVVLGLISDAAKSEQLDKSYYYYYIFDLWAERTTNCAIKHMEMFKYFTEHFPDKPVRALVESSGPQEVHLTKLYEDMRGMRPDLALFTPEFDTRTKGNKITRISALIQPFRQGLIHCNNNLEHTDSYLTFTSQLNNFPESTLDVPDALEGAVYQFNMLGTPIKREPYVGEFKEDWFL